MLVVAAGLLVSLALSVVGTPLRPSAAFYLLPTRAGEMLAGGQVYILAHGQRPSKRIRQQAASADVCESIREKLNALQHFNSCQVLLQHRRTILRLLEQAHSFMKGHRRRARSGTGLQSKALYRLAGIMSAHWLPPGTIGHVG
jgi:hypothetical protein